LVGRAGELAAEAAARALELAARVTVWKVPGALGDVGAEQYTAGVYAKALEVAGARQSMGRVATCVDNAVAESFFATLKTELVHTRAWPTRQAARTAIDEYLEVFYNRRRRHSALDYLSPAESEWRHHQQQAGTLVAA
jgi:transposase InsO family protein